MFRNREDAARQLAHKLKGRPLCDPLVLGIPRGGVVIGSVVAQELDADLDVVLARKLRAPGHHELAIGSISETGQLYLNEHADDEHSFPEGYLGKERQFQMAETARRQRLFRSVRPAAPIEGRSIVLTDDGIATGSTLLAALRVVQTQNPYEVLVAVPVASPEGLVSVQRECDEVICLLRPHQFFAIGQFYEDFEPVADKHVVDLLRPYACSPRARSAGVNSW